MRKCLLFHWAKWRPQLVTGENSVTSNSQYNNSNNYQYAIGPHSYETGRTLGNVYFPAVLGHSAYIITDYIPLSVIWFCSLMFSLSAVNLDKLVLPPYIDWVLLDEDQENCLRSIFRDSRLDRLNKNIPPLATVNKLKVPVTIKKVWAVYVMVNLQNTVKTNM